VCGPLRSVGAASESPAGDADGDDGETPQGFLGSFRLPPAGLRDRSPEAVFQVGATWGLLLLMAVAGGLCPRCSAPIEQWTEVCERHDAADGHCDRCGNRHAVHLAFECVNCLYGGQTAFAVALMDDPDVLALLVENGINSISPAAPEAFSAVLMDCGETVVSTDPFEARFTFTVDDDALTLAVDDDLTVVESTWD